MNEWKYNVKNDSWVHEIGHKVTIKQLEDYCRRKDHKVKNPKEIPDILDQLIFEAK